MKPSVCFALCLAALLFSQAAFAGDGDQNDASAKVNIWIPGFLVKAAGSIAEKHADAADIPAADMLKKFGSVNVCVRQGKYYSDKTDAKMTRKLNRMDKKNYQELMSVNSADTKVNLSIKQKSNGKIKRLAVIVDQSADTYVYVKMHCNIKMSDIAALTNTAMQCADHK